MSLKYAESRIQEALKLNKGNMARAKQQVIAWAYEDPELLQALTKNHLTGIVAYHIERVASGRASKPQTSPPSKPKKASVKSDDQFGLEILKAVANSSSAIFGLESGGVPHKRTKASQQHIDALNAMAGKSKPKK